MEGREGRKGGVKGLLKKTISSSMFVQLISFKDAGQFITCCITA